MLRGFFLAPTNTSTWRCRHPSSRNTAHLMPQLLQQLSSSSTFAVAASAHPAGESRGGESGSSSSSRRRRKLFDIDTPADTTHPAAALSTDITAATNSRRRRRPTSQSVTEPQRQQHHQQEQEQQQQPLRWWQDPQAASKLSLHVFWDLDNIHPVAMDQAAAVTESLRAALQPYGRLKHIKAYANSRTLVREIDFEGVEDMVTQEELRCPICGRRCKSFDDLQKHYRQLHEREHNKKLRGPKKASQKYAKSEKAQRVREAGRMYGTPKKNRGGRRGQMVKVLLHRAGVECIEVASQKQAADEAIHRHVDELKHRLLDPPKTKPTTKSAAGAAGGGEGGTQQDTAADDTNKHSTSTESGQLSKAVLVIVSDDRGFARTIAGWLARGGAGAVTVGERGAEGWQQPLRSSGCSRDRVGDVAHVDWGDVMAAAVVPAVVTDFESDDDEWMVDDDLESVFGPGWFL